MILSESPRRQRVTKMVSWGHWFALANIVLALVIASFYIFSSPPPGSWLGNTFMLANWLGHISFITFFGFVIFVLPCCYLVTNEKVIRLVGSVVAALGLSLLTFDALLHTRTGFHISFNAARLVSSETETRIVEFGWQQWIYLFLLFFIWFSSQLVISNSIWRRMEKLANYKFGPSFTSFFLTCFIASHGIHIWADAHLYQPVVKQDNLFPLSYPATAKTTMSRYGLLDLETYKQRKSLQFNDDVSNIKYPSEPIYCGVNKSMSAVVIMQTDNEALSLLPAELSYTSEFYDTASSFDNTVMTSIFGVPEFYADTLANKQPVLLALPQAQGMQVSVSYDGNISNPAINHYKKSFSSFEKGIHIAYMTGNEIDSAMSALSFSDTIVMVISAKQTEEQASSTLYTNLNIVSSNASNEDIAPTILSALGCQSPIDNYSTGRNLVNPEHNWIVSTSGERIIVIHNMQKIDVMSNGNYEIINLRDNTRSSEGLNIRLLSQAIKHLTRFSESH